MKCPICAEETAGQETQQWGPEWAHKRCVKAYSLGGCDARAAVELNCSVPDGWKLVPSEPTDAMAFAADEHCSAGTAKRCYIAMLSAAQTVAQPAEQDWETRAELAEQQIVCLSEERDHFRVLYQQAEAAKRMNPALSAAVLAQPAECKPQKEVFPMVIHEAGQRLELWLVTRTETGQIIPLGETGPVSFPSGWAAEYRKFLAEKFNGIGD